MSNIGWVPPSIEKKWDDLSEKTIHKDASQGQVMDLKNTFYAGALSMFYAMTSFPDDVDEDLAALAIESLKRQVHEHFEKLKTNVKG